MSVKVSLIPVQAVVKKIHLIPPFIMLDTHKPVSFFAFSAVSKGLCLNNPTISDPIFNMCFVLSKPSLYPQACANTIAAQNLCAYRIFLSLNGSCDYTFNKVFLYKGINAYNRQCRNDYGRHPVVFLRNVFGYCISKKLICRKKLSKNNCS